MNLTRRLYFYTEANIKKVVDELLLKSVALWLNYYFQRTLSLKVIEIT